MASVTMKRHGGGRVGGDHGEAPLQAPVDHETPRLSRSICGKWNSEYTKLLQKQVSMSVIFLCACKKYILMWLSAWVKLCQVSRCFTPISSEFGGRLWVHASCEEEIHDVLLFVQALTIVDLSIGQHLHQLDAKIFYMQVLWAQQQDMTN